MNIQDSLDRESSHFNLSGSHNSQSHSAKLAMQNLYRQQLDELLQQKTKIKQQQKKQKQAEKQQFNTRAINNKQSQRLKDQAYKNYYNLLMKNQDQNKLSYISPYGRDSMKDSHIRLSVEQGQQRMKAWEIQEQKRLLEKKNNYRDELMKQLEDNRRMKSESKEMENRSREEFRKYGVMPLQLEEYEKKKQRENMAKYRQDLDKIKVEQDYLKKRSLSERHNLKFYDQLPTHNPLANPLPYNIQNPYILRQMNKQATYDISNNSPIK